jgi:DNA relaxase NicK
MGRYFTEISEEDQQLGYSIVRQGRFGFIGKAARHAFFGEKDDRAMLVVSGSRAQRSILLARQGDNATRLDVQITMRVGEENVSKFLRYQATRALHGGCARGKPAEVTEVVKNRKHQTVYIGSRKSDVFVRLYDKFAESKDESHRGCIRMEVEFKGKASRALWAYLAREGFGTMYLLQCLLQTLERKGLDVSMVDLDRVDIVRPVLSKKKDDVALAWLAVQVAPVVKRLSASTGISLLQRILFEQCCNDQLQHAILQSVSVNFGN